MCESRLKNVSEIQLNAILGVLLTLAGCGVLLVIDVAVFR